LQNEQCCSTVVEELEKKYLCDEDVDNEVLFYTIAGTSPCKLASERGLRLLVLNHKCIDRVGDETRFISLGENITEADFAWNSLSEWSEVGTLLRLPNLHTLNLSHNPLKSEINADLPIAPFLQTLIINDTNLRLSAIRVFLESAPSLLELHLSENRVIEDNLDDSEEPLSLSVGTLHVNRCEIKRWETVVFLRQLLPRCSSMFISENPIKTTFIDSKTRNGRAMSGINQLNLNKCMVNEWNSVEALAEITTLRDLRISRIPLLAGLSDEEKIHLVVARMPLLEVLNGSPITKEQREKSERFFIRQDYCFHPQIFPILIARHGQLEQLCKVDLTPKKHANVIAFCEETGFRANVKVYLDQSVCSLMRMLERQTGIAMHRMRLFHISSGSSPFPEQLRFPNQKLSALRIEDGDQFLIQGQTGFCNTMAFPYCASAASSMSRIMARLDTCDDHAYGDLAAKLQPTKSQPTLLKGALKKAVGRGIQSQQ
uniref:Ubiquitin-like domain-containing protein n=1 Tax=Ascaris lumbricoides TaxID=6252 RepID=A0A9J2P2I4_ASCLU